MGLLSKIWGGIKKLFKISPIGLLIDWLTPDPPAKEAVKIPSEGSDRPVPVVYGKALVGGVKIHKWVSDIPDGMKRGYLHIIVAWAAGEIDGIEKVYLNDKDANSQDFVVGGTRLWERWDSLGGENATAIPEAVANIPNWTTNHRGRGVAHSYFRFRMDRDRQVWSGEPQIKAVIRGRRVFDPRTGTTAWSDNPALCLLDFLKSSRYGKGLPSSRINEQSFIDAANFCDQGTSNTITSTTYIPSAIRGEPPEAVTTTTTTTKKRFTLNIAVVPQDGITNAVNDIRRNFRASLPQGNGVIHLEVERDKSSVFSFGANDISGEIDYKAGSKKDRYNQVIVRFPNENKDYEKDEVAWPDRSSQDYIDFLAADNGIPLEQSFEFDGITKKHEALQMAEVICKRSRVNAQVAFTSANPKAILLEPTDVIDITDDTFGWQNKEFRITDVEPAEDGTVNISAIEYNPTVYPWNGATFDETIGGTWLGDPTYLPPPSNVQMAQDSTLSSTGTLTWQHEADAFVRRYEIVIERAGEVIFDVDVIGRSWSVPLLDAGEYIATVYAVSTLTGNRSGGAAYAFTLAAPVTPSFIALTPRDWEIEAAAQLAGIGLGTVFEYDIVTGDGTGHAPSPKGRATTFTFTGLLPNTLYTVFARAINAYGTSAWISASATTTNTGAQVEPYLDTIRDELDNVELIIDDFNSWSPAREVSELFTDVFNDFELAEDNRVTLEVAQNAGQTAEGNLLAINGIRAEIDDPTTGLGATFALAQQAEVKADGNATAINLLENDVYDVNTGLSATNTLAQQAKSTADGNTSAISALDSRVANNEDFASAQLILNASYDSDLNTLSARAFLGTDVNNRVTGIVVGDDGNLRQILFTADSVGFVDGNGALKVYYDLVNERYVFDGHIVAQTGTFSGTVSGGSIVGGNINIGSGTFTVDSSGNMVARQGLFYGSITTAEDTNTGFFTHISPIPFGTTGDLVEWYGEKVNGVTWNNATKTAIPSGMSKLNAKTYKTKNGSVFFGGTFQAGTLSLSRQTTNKTGTMTVATGTFTIPGGTSTIVVAASAVASGGGTGLGTCPLSLPSTSTIVNIERLVGSTWQNIGGSNSVAQFQCSQEGPEMLININAGAAASTSISVTPGQAITLRATAFTAEFPTTVEGVFIDGSRSLSIAVSGE